MTAEWTRSVETDPYANGCGDYARGPAVEHYYERTDPDGRVHAFEITTYHEVRSDDEDNPDAELFLTEQCHYLSAPNRDDFDAQWFDRETYDYEPLDWHPYYNLTEGEFPADAAAQFTARAEQLDYRPYLTI